MSPKGRYVYKPPVRFRFPLVAFVLIVVVLFKLVHGFEEERPSQDAIQEIPFNYIFRSLPDTKNDTTIFGDDLIFSLLPGTQLANFNKLPGPSTELQIKTESIQLPQSVQNMETTSCLPHSILDSRFQKIKETLATWRTDFREPFNTGQLYKLDLYAGLTLSASMQTYFHFCRKLTETNDLPSIPGAPQVECDRLAECFATKNSNILQQHVLFISAVHDFLELLAAFRETVECTSDSTECTECNLEYHRPDEYPMTTTTTSTTWRSRQPGTNDDEVTIPTPNPSTSTLVPSYGAYYQPRDPSYSCSDPCYCNIPKKVTDRYASKLQKFCGDFRSINTRMTDSLTNLKTSILPFWDCTLATMQVCQNAPSGDCQLSFCRDLTENSNIFANTATGYVDAFMETWNIIFSSFEREIPDFAGLFKHVD